MVATCGGHMSYVIPIYGHMTMCYTHIWSYDHVLMSLGQVMVAVLCARMGIVPPEESQISLTTDQVLARWAVSAVTYVMPIYGHMTMCYTHI